MTNAPHDGNNINTLLCLSNADGTTLIPIQADPTTHHLIIHDNNGGTDYATDNNAARDENMIPVMIAVSSADGTTPVEIYAHSTQKTLLTTST